MTKMSLKIIKKFLDYFHENKFLFLMVIIIVFALVLRLIFFTGLNCSDDKIYFITIEQILNKTFRPDWFMNLRSMLLYPIAFFNYLLGVNEFSSALWPLICSLGSIIVIFYIGKLLFDEKVGLLAAFLLSFFPLAILYGTRTMPDGPVTFFMGLSVLFFLKGGITKNKKKISYYLFSGLCFGLAYLVKELAFILAAFFVSYALYKRKFKVNYIFILIGFLIIFLSESLWYFFIAGDFLLRYKSLSENFGKTVDYWGKGIRPIDTLCFYPPVMFHVDRLTLDINDKKFIIGNCATFPTEVFGFFYYFVTFSIIYLFKKRDKNSYVLFIWLLSLFLFLEIGPRSIESLLHGKYLIIGKEIRYLNTILMPSLLILARFLNFIKSKKIIFTSLIVLLLFSSIYLTSKNKYDFDWGLKICNTRKMDIKQIYEFLKTQSEKIIYGNQFINTYLKFYFEFKKDSLIKDIESVQKAEDIKDSYVIINSSKSESLDNYYRSTIQDFRVNPPKNWVLLKVIPGFNNNTNRDFSPLIYYVP